MNKQRGFSLVEMMIAVVLGLLVTDALISLFTGVRSASSTTTGVAAVADNGRFAVDFLSQAVRSAGYMSCNSSMRQQSILSTGTSPLQSDYLEPLGGYEAVNTGVGEAINEPASPVLGAAGDWVTTNSLGTNLDLILAGLPSPPVKGTDVLVVRETLPGTNPVYVTSSTPGGSSFVVSANSGFNVGQIAVISDCVSSYAFQVAGFTPGGPGSGTIELSGAAVAPGNTQTSFPVDYSTGTQVSVIDTVVYYIGVGADGNGALYAYDTQGDVAGAAGVSLPEELVPDIENMQIMYGVDTNGSQTVDRYVTADQVENVSNTGDFNGVISVQISLLAASAPGAVPTPAAVTPLNMVGVAVTPPTDTRLRKVYNVIISLRDTTT